MSGIGTTAGLSRQGNISTDRSLRLTTLLWCSFKVDGFFLYQMSALQKVHACWIPGSGINTQENPPTWNLHFYLSKSWFCCLTPTGFKQKWVSNSNSSEGRFVLNIAAQTEPHKLEWDKPLCCQHEILSFFKTATLTIKVLQVMCHHVSWPTAKSYQKNIYFQQQQQKEKL